MVISQSPILQHYRHVCHMFYMKDLSEHGVKMFMFKILKNVANGFRYQITLFIFSFDIRVINSISENAHTTIYKYKSHKYFSVVVSSSHHWPS